MTTIQSQCAPLLYGTSISLAFAALHDPGLWGAPLKAVSAFAPPMQTQDFNLYKNAGTC